MSKDPGDHPVPALEKVSTAHFKPSLPGRTSTDINQKIDLDLFDTAEPGIDVELHVDGDESPCCNFLSTKIVRE